MGTQETLNTEHWSMYLSMMTLTKIKTNGIKNKRWTTLESMVHNITKEKKSFRIVLFIHGFSNETKKCLDKMRAHHIATISKARTPINLPDKNYHPNRAPGTHASHQSVCAPGAIIIMLITRGANPKIWKTHSWKSKTTARLAL